MDISELTDKYLEQIEVEDTDYEAVNDAVSDAAYLILILPVEMLSEYQQLKGDTGGEFPDGAEFWKETGLLGRLRTSGKIPTHAHAPLNDILEYLGGEVWGDYQSLNDSKRIRLQITEVPKFYPE